MGSYEDAPPGVLAVIIVSHSKILRMVSPMKSRLTTMTVDVVNQALTIAGKLCSLRQKLHSFLKFRSSVTAVTIIPP